jgi:hypothetical protein
VNALLCGVGTSLVLAAISTARAQGIEAIRDKAMQGDSTAQRNMAYCLRTGACGGGVVMKPIKVCAWRIVILGSGRREVRHADIGKYRLDCVSRLSGQERAMALRQAETLFRQIYKRDLPQEALVR